MLLRRVRIYLDLVHRGSCTFSQSLQTWPRSLGHSQAPRFPAGPARNRLRRHHFSPLQSCQATWKRIASSVLHLVLLLAHGPDAPRCTTPTHPSCQLTEVGACRKHALGRSELPAMQTVEVDAATGRSQTWQQMAAPSPQQKNSQGSYRLLHWSAFLPRTTLRTYMNQVPIKNWVRISNIDV